MGLRNRIKYLLYNPDIIVWAFAHTAKCHDCEPFDYCKEHQKLIEKMMEEANEY